MQFRFFGILGALVVAVMAAGAIAFAAGSPTIESTPVPAPQKPDFSSMQFLLATWTCSIKSSRRPATFTVTSTTTLDPTGYWMIAKSLQKKTSWAPFDIAATDMTTYDAWTDILISPTGNVMSTTPFTMTKVSDTKTTGHSTFKEKSGTTITVDSVCNKSG